MHSRIATLACASALAITLSACGDKDDDNRMMADTVAGASAGTLDNAPATTSSTSKVDVEDLTLGRSVGTDGKISDKTDDFRSNDEIIAVVETDDNAGGQELVARWTYRETEQLVEEQRQVIAAGSDARTMFRLKKPTAWPAGKYTLRILHNGTEVRSADFTVK